jgi:hypothetical protein
MIEKRNQNALLSAENARKCKTFKLTTTYFTRSKNGA